MALREKVRERVAKAQQTHAEAEETHDRIKEERQQQAHAEVLQRAEQVLAGAVPSPAAPLTVIQELDEEDKVCASASSECLRFCAQKELTTVEWAVSVD